MNGYIVGTEHFMWVWKFSLVFYESYHKDFNYILSSCVRKMHDKNNKLQVFALLSCPSMCHVFLICLWNYDHFALRILHGCHLQFSIQSLDSWQDAFVSLARSSFFIFSLSLFISLCSLSQRVCMMSLKYILLKRSKWYIHIFFTMQTWNSL